MQHKNQKTHLLSQHPPILFIYRDIFSKQPIIMRKMCEGNEAQRVTLLINGNTACVCVYYTYMKCSRFI